MEIDLTPYTTILKSTPHRIGAIHSALKESDFLAYKPQEDQFSFLDIVGHLIHGEIDDWIPRIRLIVEQDLTLQPPTFVPFDRFAGERMVQELSSTELVELFLAKRNESIEMLLNFEIQSDQLSWKGIHPALGEVNLEWLLNTWVAHDLSHLNQINRVLVSQFSDVGPWKEYLRILNE